MLAYIALGVAAVVALLFLLTLVRWKREQLPGPFPLPILGNLHNFVANRGRLQDYIMENTKKYGGTWLIRNGPFRFIIVRSPEVVDYYLNKNWKNYGRGEKRKLDFKELLGDGIFTSDGREWRLHRLLAKPLFRSASIEQTMIPIFGQHVRWVLEELHAAAQSKKPFNVFNLLLRYTMKTFLSVGLGCDDEVSSDEALAQFAKDFDYCSAEIAFRSLNPLRKHIQHLLAGGEKNCEFTKRIDSANAIIYDIIARRRKESEEELRRKPDILSRFMLLDDDDGKPLTDEYLRDVFMNFVLAGRDTTAALMTWTFYLLAQNPQVVDKLLEEIHNVMKGDIPTTEEVPQLQYAKQMLTETLRLYPSVPFNGRTAKGDDVLPDGTIIKKKDIVLYHPYGMGRLLWEDPLKYDPDRWSPEKEKEMAKGIFPAFHLGPQTCLGKKMAYAEALVAVCSIIKQFKVRLVPGEEDKKFAPSPILFPRDGMYLYVESRK